MNDNELLIKNIKNSNGAITLMNTVPAVELGM